MQVWPGSALFPEFWKRVPARIKQDQHRPDSMPISYSQELIQPVEESWRILFPKLVLEVNAHGVEPQGLCPAQFLVEGWQVESVRLEHLQLINGRAGQEIASHQPAVFLLPSPG